MLFKPPKRKEVNIESILNVVENEVIPKSKIKLRGTSLLAKIKAIEETVERDLGDEKDNYLLIQTREDWLSYCTQACKDGIVAIDTEYSNLDTMICKLAGICIYSLSQKPAYIPVGHYSAITNDLLPNQVDAKDIATGFQMLKDKKVKQLYHNGYVDKIVIYRTTGVWVDVYFDSLICSNLLNENEKHGLKPLYEKYCDNGGETHKFKDLFDGLIINYIPYTTVYIYGARDAMMTFKLYEFMSDFIYKDRAGCKAYGLEKISDVFWNIEMPLSDVVAKMKIRGTVFDFDKADELRIKYTKLKDEAELKFNKSVSQIKDLILQRRQEFGDIDYPINYNSPSQLKIIFYDILKAGVIFKKKPTGTGQEVIDEILSKKKYEGTILADIASHLTEVRKFNKMINDFINKLSENAKEHNGKIHCNYNQNGTDTQRFSSNSPNQQQVPAHEYKDIRNMITAGEGRVFEFFDFSQQEMMAVSVIANDKKMIESFKLGRDIYGHIASIAFDKPYEDCLEKDKNGVFNPEGDKRRRQAKSIALGELTPLMLEIA